MGTVAILAAPIHAANPLVKDIFDRDITQRGITLIDWEGYMANPAIEVSIIPPSDAAFPLQANAISREQRLYFDLPSEAGAQGPRKQLTFPSAKPVTMAISIAPARVKKKQDFAVNVNFTDARRKTWNLTIPVHVIFTDRAAGAAAAAGTAAITKPAGATLPPKPDVYPIIANFSQDKTGFYKDENRRKIFDQAIQDWAFYFARIPLQEVPAGAEKTWIFDVSGFTKSAIVTNTDAYTGLQLYSYGIDGPEDRAGGEPSRAGAFQISDGTKLQIRRSGGVEFDTKGNHNTLGWNFTIKDEEWWKATNPQDSAHDFYSIAHHESGHAIIFEPNNTKFKRGAVLRDDAVREYLGKDPAIDKSDHLAGIIDPASLHGGFGNEYNGKTPRGRWLITKVDLLVAQSVGYKLRNTDSLVPLAITTQSLPPATARKVYKATLAAQGGIPFYDWSVSEGKLPAGLTLNRFTGELTGTPASAGESSFTIQVRDYTKNGKGVSVKYTMAITS